MEEEVSTRWVLYPCRHCKGAAILGSGGGHSIFCEGCRGTGLAWVEIALL